jgi:hypothetical protein
VVGMVSALTVACGSESTEPAPDAAKNSTVDTSIVVKPDATEVSQPDAIATGPDALDAPAVTPSMDASPSSAIDAAPFPVDGAARLDLLPVDVGAGCTTAADCASGFCVRGVCCDRACNGACEHCPSEAGGKTGTCVPVPSGLLSAQCQALPSTTCGTTGACDGKGACAVYGENTICKSAHCQAGILSPPSVCNGRGQCAAPPLVSCDPYTCTSDGTACGSACSEAAGQNCLGARDAGATPDASPARG